MGIVYLIQPSVLQGTSRYKIGCSKNSDFTRLQNGYRSGTKVLNVSGTTNPHKLENMIKKEFDKNFHNYSGREFYEGDGNMMFKLFTEIVMKYNDDTQPFTCDVEPKHDVDDTKEEEIVIDEKEALKEITKDIGSVKLFVPSLKRFEINKHNNTYERRFIIDNALYTVSIPKDKWNNNMSKYVYKWINTHRNMECTFPYGHITKENNSNVNDVEVNGCEYCGKIYKSLKNKRMHMKICKHKNTNIR
jgi:hypothetical protein